MTRLIGLLFTVGISCWSISNYKLMSSDDYREIFLFTPGLLFSFYIVSLRLQQIKLYKSLFHWIILCVGYQMIIWLTICSWGIATSIFGLIGGGLISFIINDLQKFNVNKSKGFLIKGFLAGLIGITIYYLCPEEFKSIIGFVSIVGIWQLLIGLEYLGQLKKRGE